MQENSTLPEENPNHMENNLQQQVRETDTSGGWPVVSVSDGFKAEEHGGEEDGDRNSTANRWPREETMALLKIRSEMDTAFRDINPKAPLWEQVSRKLLELGYHRNAKKCKEKFENIYKYHRRTKEGRFGKSNSKNYRFFEQLEALDNNPLPSPPCSSLLDVIKDAVPCSIRFPNGNMVNVDHNNSSSTNSSEGSREEKKKRLTQFFEGMMREVTENQERLQRKLMEVLEKCEKERKAREEAWKVEELARVKREREVLAQERAISAAKYEAVLVLLKKFTENAGTVVHLPETIMVTNEKENNNHMQENVNNGGSVVHKGKDKEECGNVSVGSFMQMSSSRWPKDEVEALIKLRTEMDLQCQGNGSKVPLWEEISSAMKSIGYDRSAKRCKEKWENINKYFKRMKEKNKRKPEDSKTCPYYHHLEALYCNNNKKPKKVDESGGSSSNELRPEELLLHIMGSQEERPQQLESSSEDGERENVDDQNQNGPSIAIMG
ncbi:PREDICTED: trihelix transcription factor GT-2-like isoform X2 [Lupinus angustifolius]|uniref:trihelix transcription factor GT-2-like isoform X2 n=1 Tax=Lupinus angustifolius TaxID=3871 RepID=UPI00092FD38D|nr:PREDICTED: trihelix transcription factor GT-2-like isoform X2 [Lupinus angustifolius]